MEIAKALVSSNLVSLSNLVVLSIFDFIQVGNSRFRGRLRWSLVLGR